MVQAVRLGGGDEIGDGAVLADGTRLDVDAVVWATGTRPSLRHLAPLRLRDLRSGAAPRDGWSRFDPRIGFAGSTAPADTQAALDAAIALATVADDHMDDAVRRRR